jgi:hypothetical protein
MSLKVFLITASVLAFGVMFLDTFTTILAWLVGFIAVGGGLALAFAFATEVWAPPPYKTTVRVGAITVGAAFMLYLFVFRWM